MTDKYNLLRLQDECKNLQVQAWSMLHWSRSSACDLGMSMSQEEIDNHWTTHVSRVAVSVLDQIKELQEKFELEDSTGHTPTKVFEKIGPVIVNDYAAGKVTENTNV